MSHCISTTACARKARWKVCPTTVCQILLRLEPLARFHTSYCLQGESEDCDTRHGWGWVRHWTTQRLLNSAVFESSIISMKVYMTWPRMFFLSVILKHSLSLSLQYILDLSISAGFSIALQRFFRDTTSQPLEHCLLLYLRSSCLCDSKIIRFLLIRHG